MGLPVWRAPSPEAKDTRKVDPSASARSPIRRRSPYASSRRNRATRSRSPRLLDHRDFDYGALAAVPTRAELLARSSGGRRRTFAPPAAPEISSQPRADVSLAGWERSRPSFFSLMEDDDRSASNMRMRRDTTYRTMFEPTATDAPSRPTDNAYLHRHFVPLTPNFAPAAASRNVRVVDGPVEQETTRPNPATRPADAWVTVLNTWGEGPDDHTVIFDHTDGNHGNHDNNAVGFPPLRRMGRRTIADGPLPSSSLRESWSPATTALDGLGDRERSFSPIDDHWDTMLSTVISDPLPPSADSSFTSAAASASFSQSHPSSRSGSSNSNSAASSRTHLTVPSQHGSPPTDMPARACETSDDDTASDTEDEDDIYPPLPPLDPSPPSQFNVFRHVLDLYEPATLNPQPNRRPRFMGNLGPRGIASPPPNTNLPGETVSFYQLDDPSENQIEADIQTLDQELRDARSILERIVRRDDVADDFWASVGLTRPMADHVEHLQQRDRSQ